MSALAAFLLMDSILLVSVSVIMADVYFSRTVWASDVTHSAILIFGLQ